MSILTEKIKKLLYREHDNHFVGAPLRHLGSEETMLLEKLIKQCEDFEKKADELYLEKHNETKGFKLGDIVRLSMFSDSKYRGERGIIVGKKDFYIKEGIDTSYDIKFGDEIVKDFNDFWFELKEEKKDKTITMVLPNLETKLGEYYYILKKEGDFKPIGKLVETDYDIQKEQLRFTYYFTGGNNYTEIYDNKAKLIGDKELYNEEEKKDKELANELYNALKNELAKTKFEWATTPLEKLTLPTSEELKTMNKEYNKAWRKEIEPYWAKGGFGFGSGKDIARINDMFSSTNPSGDGFKYWFESLNEKPIDTSNMVSEAYLDMVNHMAFYGQEKHKQDRKDFLNKIFGSSKIIFRKGEEKNMIPRYIGYKDRTTTLVWNDGSKTQAIAKGEEEIDYSYGFLIAYYKRVHQDLHSGALQKRLEKLLYNEDMEWQKIYLESVFVENCGLSLKKAERFVNDYVINVNLPFGPQPINETYVVDEKYWK